MDKNPLEAIEHLREVKMVMIGGQVVLEPKVKHIKAIDKKLDRLIDVET